MRLQDFETPSPSHLIRSQSPVDGRLSVSVPAAVRMAVIWMM
jgi:hypothetical protein